MKKIIRLIILISIMSLCFIAGHFFTLELAYNKAGEYYEQRWKYECVVPKEMPKPELFQWAEGQLKNNTLETYKTDTILQKTD
jgi:hypothetical protein